MVIFYQALGSVAQGGPPVVPFKGEGVNIFGDHFHPLILVVVPFLWLWNSPVTLLIVQSAAVAVAMALLHRTTVELAPADRRAPAWIWVVSPAVLAAVAFDFHELTLAAPLIAWTCRVFLQERHRLVCVGALAILLVKEDAALLTLGFGVALLARKRWVGGAALVSAALAWAWVVVATVIPRFNRDGVYSYANSESNVASTLTHNLVWPGWATLTAVALLALTAMRAVRSPLIWPAAAWWGGHALILNDRFQIPFYHYHVLPGIILGFATIVGWRERPPRRATTRLIAVVAALAALVGPATIRLAVATQNRPLTARDAVAVVPRGASAAADPKLLGLLASRTPDLTLARPPRLVNGSDRPTHPAFVVLDRRTHSYGGGWVGEFISTQLADYAVVFERDGYVVLRRNR